MADEASDSVQRAMTDDGAFRVITTRTSDTVREAIARQGVSGASARVLAEMITGAILVRETMAPRQRVQGILQGAAGRGKVVADSNPDGSARGLVRVPDGSGTVALGAGALLQMMRTLPNGDLQRGVVEVPATDGISGALMSYMQSSEQVVSAISVGVAFDGDAVQAAGGYVVQLLPELEEGPLMVMTERLREFPPMERLLRDGLASPTALTDELLYGMPFTRLDENPLRFECGCSEVRVLGSLATLGRADIQHLMEDDQPLEIQCDYCGAEYRISPERLRGLLDPA